MSYSAPQNETTVLSTTGLADDNVEVGGTVFDNSTNKDAWAIAELDLGTSTDLSSGNTNPVVYLYMAPSFDGTNYADGGDATGDVAPSEYLKGVFEFNKLSGSLIAVLDKFDIAPIKYEVAIYNDLGVAIPSGTTVKIKSFDRA